MTNDPTSVEFYEGLVRKTTARFLERIRDKNPDLEFDDVCQMLRLKAWRAIEGYNPERATQTIDGYVFSCVTNQIKDLVKRKRRTEDSLDEMRQPGYGSTPDNGYDNLARDRFDLDHFLLSEESAFEEILNETPLIPSTLSPIERRVVTCLYLHYEQAEIAETLNLSRREVARRVKSIKEKMADWRPGAASNGNGDHRPTPLKEAPDGRPGVPQQA